MHKLNDGRWKCDRCEYVGKEGHTRQHELKAHTLKDNANGEKSTKVRNYSCPLCKGKLRLLRSNDRKEKVVIEHGGYFVCKACDEVLDKNRKVAE